MRRPPALRSGAADAARLLPATSRIRIEQVGRAYTPVRSAPVSPRAGQSGRTLTHGLVSWQGADQAAHTGQGDAFAHRFLWLVEAFQRMNNDRAAVPMDG